MSWTLYWVLLAIGIVMTGIFLFLRVKKGGISALYAKAAASLCFQPLLPQQAQTATIFNSAFGWRLDLYSEWSAIFGLT